MCESMEAVANLEAVLTEVPGIGVVLVGESDLTHDMGIPQQYDHSTFRDVLRQVAEICPSRGVGMAAGHASRRNVGELLEMGYRFLMTRPAWSYDGLDEGLRLTDRRA